MGIISIIAVIFQLGVDWFQNRIQRGGKSVLLGITKRGNPYLRTLLNHGARTVLKNCEGKNDRLSLWAQKLKKEKHYNQACIAVANKLARIVWAVISKDEEYQVNYL